MRRYKLRRSGVDRPTISISESEIWRGAVEYIVLPKHANGASDEYEQGAVDRRDADSENGSGAGIPLGFGGLSFGSERSHSPGPSDGSAEDDVSIRSARAVVDLLAEKPNGFREPGADQSASGRQRIGIEH